MLEISEATAGLRWLASVPGYLRRPYSPEQAEQIVRRRLANRARDLSRILDLAVFRNPASPYLRLLRGAGCEQGDLQRLLDQDGVEGALRTLFRRGVYLTADEFKGRQPVRRGSLEFTVQPDSLRNPLESTYLRVTTSGSSGRPTLVPLQLAHTRDVAVDTLLALEPLGGRRWVKAQWEVPGSGVVGRLIEFSRIGRRPSRWFSPLDPRSGELPERYRWGVRLLQLASAAAGTPLPGPEHVPLSEPGPIVDWFARCLAAGETPHLWTYPSPAMIVCQAAERAGLDLSGARLTLSGEPLTAIRRQTIERTGAQVWSRYGGVDFGRTAHGCFAPAWPDEHHILGDLVAVIQPGEAAPEVDLPANALLVTALRPTFGLVGLNVSPGDVAETFSRSCGCSLDRDGWRLHLRSLRSFKKLSAGGMTLLDGDLVPTLEQALPAAFGGGPTDYQLVEDQASDGQARLCLLIHPRLGPLEPGRARELFLAEVGRVGGAAQVAALHWRAADLLRVERRVPYSTRTGKIPLVHRPSGSAEAAGRSEAGPAGTARSS
jgi:hypothetical protein